MSISIRISDEIYDQAKQVASAEFRSVPSQIEMWARIGKCALDNPDLPTEFIKDTMISKNSGPGIAEPFSFDDE